MTPRSPPAAPMRCCSISAASCSISISPRRSPAGRDMPAASRRAIVARFVRDSEAYRQHEIGKISDDAYFACLRASLGIGISRRAVPGRLERDLRRRNARHRALLPRAAKQLPLYAFSNTNRPHVDHFSKAYAEPARPFPRDVSVVHDRPSETRCGAYDHVVEAIGVPAERIVFFDDLAENIEGARARGLTAVHVTSPARRRERPEGARNLTHLVRQPDAAARLELFCRGRGTRTLCAFLYRVPGTITPLGTL